MKYIFIIFFAIAHIGCDSTSGISIEIGDQLEIKLGEPLENSDLDGFMIKSTYTSETNFDEILLVPLSNSSYSVIVKKVNNKIEAIQVNSSDLDILRIEINLGNEEKIIIDEFSPKHFLVSKSQILVSNNVCDSISIVNILNLHKLVDKDFNF